MSDTDKAVSKTYYNHEERKQKCRLGPARNEITRRSSLFCFVVFFQPNTEHNKNDKRNETSKQTYDN